MERVVCPVLIGREIELTELEDALLAANRGDGQIVLLAGEAGVGKSRLATEVQRRAVKIGITVLSGGCSEADLALPYLPFLEALGNYLTAVDLDQVRKGLGSLRRELAHLFPQLEPEAESRETGDPTQAKLRLFEAILALLRLAAQQTGIAAHPRGPALVGRVYPRAARLPDEALARHANHAARHLSRRRAESQAPAGAPHPGLAAHQGRAGHRPPATAARRDRRHGPRDLRFRRGHRRVSRLPASKVRGQPIRAGRAAQRSGRSR